MTGGDIGGFKLVPVFVLATTFLLGLIALTLGWHVIPDWRAALAVGLAVMFLLTASAHWGHSRKDLVKMVPRRFKNPEQMVTLTGLLEVVGSIGLLLPHTRKYAAIGLVLLLIAMLPANIYAATANLSFNGKPITPLRWRVPLQALYVVCLVIVVW